MLLHIGNLIKEVMDIKGIGVTDLARSIYCSRTNVYKILTRHSIDTALLQRISVALEHNFFQEIAQIMENNPQYEFTFPVTDLEQCHKLKDYAPQSLSLA